MKVRLNGVRRVCRIVVAYVVASTGSGDGPSHLTPSFAAASTPERAPSSWKPQPCQAPAKTTRSVSHSGSRRWAATEAGV